MGTNESELLDGMAANDRRFAALYRGAARSFGLSESAMWVLYYIHVADGPVSQQDLIERMALPKQTVNSAVTALVAKGHIELEAIPGTRNRKRVLLTDAGTELVDRTVARMRATEERAVQALGDERARLYVELHEDFLAALEGEFEGRGMRNGK